MRLTASNPIADPTKETFMRQTLKAALVVALAAAGLAHAQTELVVATVKVLSQ